MQIKKSIFLRSYLNNNSSGILSLEKEDNFLKCNLNLYNFNGEIKNLALGVNINGKVLKFPVRSEATTFKIDLLNKELFEAEISCALVDLKDITSPKVLLGAAATKLETFIDSFALSNRAKLYEYTESEIEDIIDSETSKALSQNKDNLYKKSYKKAEILSEKPITFDEDLEKEEESNQFYNKIKKQLDELFLNNKSEEILQTILPESKWIKIDYENESGYYALGIIYNNLKPKYICYALPKSSPRPIPADIKEYAQWLPLDIQKPEENGYWIVYQDANDGSSLIVDII